MNTKTNEKDMVKIVRIILRFMGYGFVTIFYIVGILVAGDMIMEVWNRNDKLNFLIAISMFAFMYILWITLGILVLYLVELMLNGDDNPIGNFWTKVFKGMDED